MPYYKDKGDLEYKILLGGSLKTNSCPDVYPEDMVVGFRSGDKQHCFGMTAGQLSKHLLLIGGIGCGKTNTFNEILEQLLTQMGEDDVMFIFDTKGDFKNLFYQPENKLHAIIGNGPTYRNVTRYWNIYQELMPDREYKGQESDLAAKELATMLFKGTGGANNTFFETTSADLFAMKLIDTMRRGHCDENEIDQDRISRARTVQAEEWNNGALKRFFDRMTLDSLHDIIDRNEDFESARSYIGQRGQEMNGQSGGIMAQITTVVNSLFVGIFGQKALGGRQGNLSMRRCVRNKGGRVVFVEYDLSIGEKLGPVYRTMFDLAMKEALGRSEGEKGNGNVYFIVDEFKLLPNLNHIDDALNFGRSLGVKVVAGIQNVHQIYDIYGSERGQALFAGFMNSFCFQTPDPDTRKYMSQRMGTNYGSISYHMMLSPQIVNRDGQTAEDWDLLNLNIGQACVELVQVEPFLFQFSRFSPGEH